MFPLAALSTMAGAWIVTRMKAEVFYPYMIGMLLLVSAKLAWEGFAGLVG